MINKLSWEYLGANVLELVKKHAATNTQSIAQFVKSMHSLGLREQVEKVVEVGTSHIVARVGLIGAVRCDNLVHWLILLASDDNLGSQYSDFVQQILNINGSTMINIIVEMHKSIKPEVMGQNKIIECLQNVLKNLQDKGWKNFSPYLVTLVIPIILFVDKNELLNSLVQEIIQQENSTDFLNPILNLPIVLREKDNQSIQLMVQTRLDQLEKNQPAFSWAQPNATLIPRHDRWPQSGPLPNYIDFLRSDVQSKTFGHFVNIEHARRLGKNFFPDGNYNTKGCYSATYVTTGRGKDAKCIITKTRNVFEERMKNYTNLCREAEVLRNKFCVPKKTVAKKRALE